MLPLEVVFLLLVIIWAMIGAVRGFSREIGATIAIVMAMSGLSLFGPLLATAINKSFGNLGSFSIPLAESVPEGAKAFCYAASPQQFIFYTIVFGVIVFMGYQGETLGLPTKVGKLSSGILGMFAGIVNGWMVAGNLWYFLDKCANYNVPSLGIRSVGVLSETAQTIIKILPLNLIGEPAILIALLMLLLLVRIAK